MVFKNLKCLLPNKHGQTCGKHLLDIESGKECTVRVTCKQRHKKDTTDKIEFHQNKKGVISWRPIPMDEKKDYDDDGSRIGIASEDGEA